jgi:hypothetical protein
VPDHPVVVPPAGAARRRPATYALGLLNIELNVERITVARVA